MSVEIVRSIRCDGGCGMVFTATEPMPVPRLRQKAVHSGWHSRMRTRDICPWCWDRGRR